MKQSDFLKSIAVFLTSIPKRENQKSMFILMLCVPLYEEDRDLKPKRCPYCGKESRYDQRKGLKTGKAIICVKIVVISSLGQFTHNYNVLHRN